MQVVSIGQATVDSLLRDCWSLTGSSKLQLHSGVDLSEDPLGFECGFLDPSAFSVGSIHVTNPPFLVLLLINSIDF